MATNLSEIDIDLWQGKQNSLQNEKPTPMIKEVTMYTVICDNCGRDVNQESEYSCFNDKEFIEDMSFESGWIKEGYKHYCPACYDYDDDDNIVINNKPIV